MTIKKTTHSKFFVKISAWIIAHTIPVLIFLLVSSATFAFFSLRIVINNSNDVFFVPHDPMMKAYKKFQDSFGSEEFLMVYFSSEDLFNEENYRKIISIHNELEKLTFEGKQVFPSILTPFHAPVVFSQNGAIKVENLLPKDEIPTKEALNRVKHTILKHPIYKNLLVNEEGNAGALIASMRPNMDENYTLFAAEKAQNIIDASGPSTLRRLLVGGPALKRTLDQATASETAIFGTAALLVSVALLLFLFRNFRQVLATIMSVLIAVIWTVGTMSILQVEMTLLMIILPLVIIVTGLGSSVHIINNYRAKIRKGTLPKNAIANATGDVGKACFFTVLTTAIGFLSMVVAPIQPIKILGLFAAIGVLLSFLFTLLILPLALGADKKAHRKLHKRSEEKLLKAFFEWICRVSLTSPRTTTIVSGLVFSFMIMGVLAIKVESNFTQALHESHPQRIAVEMVDKNLGGSSTLEVIVDTQLQNGVYEPSFLKALQQFGRNILEEQSDVVSAVLSPEQIILEVQHALVGNRSIPTSKEGAVQLAFLYEISGGNSRSFIDSNAQTARISLRTRSMSTARALQLEQEVLSLANQTFPNSKLDATGVNQLFVHLSHYVIDSQIRAFVIAAIVICILMIWLFRSLILGLGTMIPNVLPVLATYGIMGWLSLPLDWMSAVIPGIALGVAVDGTIHIGSRFQKSIREGKQPVDAADDVIRNIGKALIISSLTLAAGFSVFSLSILESLARLGLLLAFCLLLALIADLVMTPALLTWLSTKNRTT